MIRFFLPLIVAGLFPAYALDERTAPRGREDGFPDTLALILNDAARANVPLAPLENKIREGLAKKRPESEIIAAVRARKAALEQVREWAGGTLPEGYTKLLFAYERKNTPVPSAAPDAIQSTNSESKQVLSAKKPLPVRSRTVRVEKTRHVGEKSVVGKNAEEQNVHFSQSTPIPQEKSDTAAVKKPDLKFDKSTKHRDNSVEHAEKLAEKAAKKAEAKQKALEKRMEKIERRKERKQP